MRLELTNTEVGLSSISQKLWGERDSVTQRFLVGQTVRETIKRAG